MGDISISKTREIVEDFAKLIKEKAEAATPPLKTVIEFRRMRQKGLECDVYEIPIKLLRYRKENGRIASDVLSYEKEHGTLNERKEEDQKILREFLKNKSKEKTKELYQSIKHDGQREAAIITCDGFLINGNRRKMVMEELYEKEHQDSRYKNMRVVILPGKDDPGGPPTLLEIEEIENRYQLQSDGKAEYTNFDKAITLKQKRDKGMSLERQILDDPRYAGLTGKALEKEVKKIENDYIKPLECIDRYLEGLNRGHLYENVSSGVGDPEGRWQAFLDYYNFVYKRITNPKKREVMNLDEDLVGDVEDVCFKLIRKRKMKGLPGVTKVHDLMRQVPKILRDPDTRKEFLKIGEISDELEEKEKFDKSGKELSCRAIDEVWGNKHAEFITRQAKKALVLKQHIEDRETPITLLDAALKKLNHDAMVSDNVTLGDLEKAMTLTKEIQERADELEGEFWNARETLKKLKDKFKKK